MAWQTGQKRAYCMEKIHMKFIKRCSVLMVFLSVPTFSSANTSDELKLGHAPVEDIVKAMTLDEKVMLVRGTGMAMETGGPQVGVTKDKVPGAAGTTYAIERLGIPSIVFADGPAGLRISPTRDDHEATFYATAFPIATLIGSSWNLPLVQKFGQAVGNEAKAYGIDVMLAPALNIHRHAMGGRNFEYFSEDPVVSGMMSAAYVEGLQYQGVGATLKHFVANNHEWNRDQIDVEVDEKTFREIYLKGFEIAVKESAPWALMSSYNKVNGEYTSESSAILTDTLRHQWGFDGIVMTDWFGGDNPVKQMSAGNDLLMPGMDHQNAIIKGAVENGALEESVLDRNVRNILNLIVKTHSFKKSTVTNKPPLQEHAKLARQIATEGMVLLKNEHQALPLQAGASVALLGNSSYQTAIGGTGSGDVHEAYSISIAQGLKNAGIHLSEELSLRYDKHIATETANLPVSHHPLADMMPSPALGELDISTTLAEALAQTHDVAIFTLGRNSGEFVDREREDFYLTEHEQALLTELSRAFSAKNKPFIVLLNVGGVIETQSWKEKADAILLTHLPGQEAGNAVADILTGEVSPSGKLASTWPLKLEDYPSDKGFPGFITDKEAEPNGITGSQPSKVVYQEGTRVGYRYFDAASEAVAFPFGFGLSYANFSYQNVSLSSTSFSDEVKVKVTVTNTGEVPAKDVVQLYIGAPQGPQSLIKKQLKHFAKTTLLAPKASEDVVFTLTAEDLMSFNTEKNAWYAEAGLYDVHLATSSKNIFSTQPLELKSPIYQPL